MLFTYLIVHIEARIREREVNNCPVQTLIGQVGHDFLGRVKGDGYEKAAILQYSVGLRGHLLNHVIAMIVGAHRERIQGLLVRLEMQ